MSAILRINLLGPIYVEWKGTPVNISDFGSRKDLALFCFLVTERKPLSRHHLANLFWHNKNERLGLNNLNRVLSQLRKLLPGCIQSDQYYVTFTPEFPVWIDIDTLIQLEAQHDVESMAMAASLYQGEFMGGFLMNSGFEFESWLTVQREKWLQKTATILRQLMDHYTFLENDQQEQGLEYASKLLEIQPWRESAHRRKMRMLARVQRFSAALMQYEICKRVLAQELNVQPSHKTVELYERIKIAREQKPQKLPIALTPFVGRRTEISYISTLLAKRHCRLLTITGPGGIGKTRIALATAHGKAGLFLNGTYFISLSKIDGSHQLPQILADTFDISVPKNVPTIEAVLLFLKDKEILLVLDEYDHILDSQGKQQIIEMLTTASQLKIIVTSRQRLKITGEHVIEIQSLKFPPQNTDLDLPSLCKKYSAVSLFLEIARNTQADFSPTNSEMYDIILICRLLSGMPLAIEMAATWVRTSSCQQIAESLRQGILFSDNAEYPEVSHLSVKAAFDYSWNQLSLQEQKAFSRLSIFRGGFLREAAQKVCDASISELSKLVDVSLLHWDPESKRYEIHELLRQYAAQKLGERPVDQRDVEILHSKYFSDYIHRRDVSLGRNLVTNRAEIRREISNICLGWKHAVKHDQANMIAQSLDGLWGYYEAVGEFAEAVQTFEVVSQFWSETEKTLSDYQRFLTGQILARQAWFGCRMGYFGDAQTIASKSLAYLENNGGNKVYHQPGWPYYLMGISNWHLGNYSLARQWLESSLIDFKQHSDELGASLARYDLGALYESLGKLEKARQYLEENIQLAKKQNNERSFWLNTALLGKVAFWQGDHEIFEKYLSDACAYFESIQDNYTLATCYGIQGNITYLQGNYQLSHQTILQALNLIKAFKDPWLEARLRFQLGCVIGAISSKEEATQILSNALKLAIGINAVPLILTIIVGFTTILPPFRIEESNKEIRSLLEFIQNHPAVTFEANNEAKRILVQLDLTQNPEPALARQFLNKEFGADIEFLIDKISY